MITHIHSTTIYIQDQDKALDYYCNKLGFEKRHDDLYGEGMRFVTVAPEGALTELTLELDDGTDKPKGGITFIADDLDATYAELSAKGVSFSAPVETMPWGAKATWLVDPCGNTFFFTEGR